MTAHRHANRAASQCCTNPDCLARYAAALERGAADTARIDAETTARLHARTAHSTVAWAAIIGQVPAWQAMARAAGEGSKNHERQGVLPAAQQPHGHRPGASTPAAVVEGVPRADRLRP